MKRSSHSKATRADSSAVRPPPPAPPAPPRAASEPVPPSERARSAPIEARKSQPSGRQSARVSWRCSSVSSFSGSGHSPESGRVRIAMPLRMVTTMPAGGHSSATQGGLRSRRARGCATCTDGPATSDVAVRLSIDSVAASIATRLGTSASGERGVDRACGVARLHNAVRC